MDLLGELRESEEFDGIPSSKSQDIFEEISRLRPLLVAGDADVTIPLQACEKFVTGLRLRGPVRDITVFWHLVHDRGIWQNELTEAIMALLRPGDVFLDVGANFGYFTVLAASRSGSRHPGSRPPAAIAFEPLETHAGYCRLNVRLNGLNNAQVVPYALWNEETTMQIQEDGGLADQMGGAHLVSTRSESQGEGKQQLVKCVTLDGLVESGEVAIPKCRLVKIDIEGAEPLALAGMTKTLERTRPLMLVEFNKYCLERMGQSVASLWDGLQGLGYSMYALPAQHQVSFAESVIASPDAAQNRLGTPGVRLLRLNTLEKAAELTEVLDNARPPSDPIDLLAVPAGLGLSSGL